MKTTTETIYTCDHCQRKMFQKGSMTVHERRCKKNPNNQHACLKWCKHLVKHQCCDSGEVEFYCSERIQFGDMRTYKKDGDPRYKSLTRMPLECDKYEDKNPNWNNLNMTKTKLCHECRHYASYGRYVMTGKVCEKQHKPRFYLPRNGNPHDPLAGYRRKCDDFEPEKQ